MKKSKRVGNNVIFFVLLILSVLFLVPIIIVIINSFKSRIYISSQPLKLPNAETFVALEIRDTWSRCAFLAWFAESSARIFSRLFYAPFLLLL